MLQVFDILFSASCYNSASNAERMVRTLPFLNCKTLFIVTSPRQEDLNYLKSKNFPNLILFKSDLKNMYMCRNWGFIWAVRSQITSKYYCSCDDDIEFTENSRDILSRLDNNDFSVMTFNNTVQIYNAWNSGLQGTCRMVSWINGDSMFTHWIDNLKYGLPDCLPDSDPLPICSETEYGQRLYALSGKPILADIERNDFYIHHFRDSSSKIELRDNRIVARINSGVDFFSTKYPGIFPHPRIDINSYDVHGALLRHIRAHPEQSKCHLLYNGLWNDFGKIYEQYKDHFNLIT